MNIWKLCSETRDYLDIQNALKAKPNVQCYVLIDFTLLSYSCAFTRRVARCTATVCREFNTLSPAVEGSWPLKFLLEEIMKLWKQCGIKYNRSNNSDYKSEKRWGTINKRQTRHIVKIMSTITRRLSSQTYRLVVKLVTLSMMTGKNVIAVKKKSTLITQ